MIVKQWRLRTIEAAVTLLTSAQLLLRWLRSILHIEFLLSSESNL